MSTLDEAMGYLADMNAPDTWHTLVSGLEYKKVMGVTYIRCYITGNTFNTAYKIVGTLPSGYRPNTIMYTVCGFSNGGQGIAYFNTNGAIGIKTDTGTAPNVWFMVSFPVDS